MNIGDIINTNSLWDGNVYKCPFCRCSHIDILWERDKDYVRQGAYIHFPCGFVFYSAPPVSSGAGRIETVVLVCRKSDVRFMDTESLKNHIQKLLMETA